MFRLRRAAWRQGNYPGAELGARTTAGRNRRGPHRGRPTTHSLLLKPWEQMTPHCHLRHLGTLRAPHPPPNTPRPLAAPYHHPTQGSFSSTDFADLACACARLFGTPAGPTAANCASNNGSTAVTAATAPPPPPLPPQVAALLDGLASEVRRQLANKSSISPWTPRDLVRLARAYAALGPASPRARQMLDALSSFCVQRIRVRHLNCVSRPADLTGAQPGPGWRRSQGPTAGTGFCSRQEG